ncbi:hypothetical protein AALB53_16380 [Lachnospiraceae bacterium 47-T17]
MRRVIDSFIKSIGVSVILERKVFRGLLDVYYYNFIGKDDKFYSFLVACNDTQIILDPQKYFMFASDFCDEDAELKVLSLQYCVDEMDVDLLLARNLRVFCSKEDWIVGRWCTDSAKAFDQELRRTVKECFNECCRVGEYELIQHSIWTRPALGFSIMYNKNGVFGGVVTVWHGSITELEYSQGLHDFLVELGIEHFIRWR